MSPRLHQKSIAAILVIALGSQLTGCGYPPVSPKAYELSKALYAVCNQKNAERLPVVSDLIQASLTDESITKSEGQWLNNIVDAGKNGEWETATQEARSLMDDQVDR